MVPFYAGPSNALPEAASIKHIPCKQPDNDMLAGPTFTVTWLITQVRLRPFTHRGRPSQLEDHRSCATPRQGRGKNKLSPSIALYRAVIVPRCLAGDERLGTCAHTYANTQGGRQRVRLWEHKLCEAERRVRRDNRVISFQRSAINYTPPLRWCTSFLLKCSEKTAVIVLLWMCRLPRSSCNKLLIVHRHWGAITFTKTIFSCYSMKLLLPGYSITLKNIIKIYFYQSIPIHFRWPHFNSRWLHVGSRPQGWKTLKFQNELNLRKCIRNEWIIF